MAEEGRKPSGRAPGSQTELPARIDVREARTEDLPAIVLAHLDAETVTLRAVFPSGFLEIWQPTIEGLTHAWTKHMEDHAAGETVLVGLLDDEVVGVAHAGPTDEAGSAVLRALYVQSNAWGSGVGRALHAATLERLREAGFGEARLQVIHGNERARRFYEREGWTVSGPAERNQFELPLVPYRRTL